ncbi:ABC transporter permease subunit [Saccharopolyspora tripterygii]
MVWVAWRQQRVALLVLASLLVVGAVAMVLLRLDAEAAIAERGIAHCLVENWFLEPGCRLPVQEFQDVHYDRIKYAELILIAIPLVLGVFCAAPLLARELESGTHVLALSQSVGRMRWLAVKLAVALVPAVVVLAVHSALLQQWLATVGPLGPAKEGLYTALNFDNDGVLPVVHAVFAYLLGVWAGVVTRRTVPAMLIAGAGYVVLRFAGVVLMRRQLAFALGGDEGRSYATLLAPEHFWSMQSVEAAVFLAIGGALLLGAVRRLRGNALVL